MQNSRITKRPGYGVNRGATNPKITVNATAPLNPKHKDLWFNTGTSTWKWWDATASPPAWTA